MDNMEELLKMFEEASILVETTLISFVQKQQQTITSDHDLQQMQEQIKQLPQDKFKSENLAQTTITEQQISLLQNIPDIKYSENMEQKIKNLKMNSVSSRRKDELFKRFRKEQEERIVQRRKQLEQKFNFKEEEKDQGEFSIKRGQKQQRFTLKYEDFQKLKPQTDLNDTILDNYLKIVQLAIIPPEIQEKTFIFSSFFMGKLLGEAIQGDFTSQKQSELYLNKIRNRIKENYSSIKRWSRRIDLFSKQIIVIPINSFKHWNCIIILSPNTICQQQNMCKILYFDSMFQKRMMFPEAFKTYLELQLNERKGIKKDLSDIKTFQLLVPRQTNTHDCGLYTLCYIQFLLSNQEFIESLINNFQNKDLLQLFPRSIIFTMRECLRWLFYNLLKKENKQQVLKNYIKMREDIIEDSHSEIDYDVINERQFKKYYKINGQFMGEEDKMKESQLQFLCKIKFYLDCEVNHYQKDR